jgi:hypothetical protein
MMLSVVFAKLPTPIFAATCNHNFFGFPHWWEYLQLNGQCEVANFQVPGDIFAVGLAIVDMLLRLGGMVAVIMVIVSGAKYMTAQGNSEKAASARRSTINSLVGLAIVLVAVGVVSFIGNKIGGS